MGWIPAIAGLCLGLVLSVNSEFVRQTHWMSKRSVDLNHVYNFKARPDECPDSIIPTSYQLELEPFVGDDKFNGRVKINVTWAFATDRITLNVHPQLLVTHYDVKLIDTSPAEMEQGLPAKGVNITRVELPRASTYLYVIHLDETLKEGSMCELDLHFTGTLTINEISGLFRNEYTDNNGTEHSVIGTYLRMGRAPTVFPCIDEPPYKAMFKLSVLRPKNMTARSNMPLERSTEAPGQPDLIWDHFEQTPRMAASQLALLISDFGSISPTMEINEMDGRKLDVKVWGRKAYLRYFEDVPDKIVKIMNYLQDYFNSSIILPKLDIVSIPMYRATKPADSWGMILFSESELGYPSMWNLAYELIFQWIGQYITPRYGRDASAINAIASFFASMTIVDINPDEMEGKWPMTMLYSLYYEFGKTTPYSRVAGIRNEASSAQKELILRMFNYTLGKEVFQTSVRNFIHQTLKKDLRAFHPNDIYLQLEEVANKTGNLPPGLGINAIAQSWINRNRVPLVTVMRDYETKRITFSQKVYRREAPPVSIGRVTYQWDIPIVMVTQDNLDFSKTKPTVWMTTEAGNMTIQTDVDKDSFIIVNPEEIGIFPVNYDSCNWMMLSRFLEGPNRDSIPALTRAKLLHDAWNLAYAGELCSGTALDMTLFLKEERSHIVWEALFTMIDHIGRRLEGSAVYPKFEAYIRTLLKPLYLELNETAETGGPSWKVRMHGLTKNFLCLAGYEPCVKEARDQFKKWLTDEEPDVANPVANKFLCTVFKWGTEEEWEFGLQRVINFPQHNPERKQNERSYLLKTLAGCPKDSYKIKRLLNVTILDQNANFSDADIHLIFSMLTGGGAGYTTLFDFLVEHWDTLMLKFENKKHLWEGIINSATSPFNTEEGFHMVTELYANHRGEFKTAENTIREALRIIKHKKEWSKNNLCVIDAWLTENLPKEELEALQDCMCTTEFPALDCKNSSEEPDKQLVKETERCGRK